MSQEQRISEKPCVAKSIYEQDYRALHWLVLDLREMLGVADGDSLKAAVQSLIARAAAAPSAEQAEPVAWYVMNGVQLYQLCCTENQANALSNQLQKQHDLSGSLASFHVKPLYTHAQPAQPAREPMTEQDRGDCWENSVVTSDWEAVDAYMQGISDAEAHHGITAESGEVK